MCQRLEVLLTVNDLLSAPMPPTRWYDGLAQYQQQGVAHVLATVIAVNGSAPRALQAKMIVTVDSYCDTLGGGGLEHDVIMTARQLLSGEIEATVSKDVKEKHSRKDKDSQQGNTINSDGDSDLESKPAKAVRRDSVYTKHYPLGAKLAQCCGGSVTVMFECFNVIPPLSILVFGAGHVAAALMTILAELPCQVDWIDSRPEMFAPYLLNKSDQINGFPKAFGEPSASEQSSLYQLPAHIRPHVSEEPVDFIHPFIEPFIEQGDQRFILIMTHDHSLDFDLVRAAIDVSLATNDADIRRNTDNVMTDYDGLQVSMPYIGCIGSATKAKRFKDRLTQRGYSEQVVDRLTMPIGLLIGGKEPMAVAVSIAAQILQHYYQT
jgi:xanthine dehydrogenase accessory factor